MPFRASILWQNQQPAKNTKTKSHRNLLFSSTSVLSLRIPLCVPHRPDFHIAPKMFILISRLGLKRPYRTKNVHSHFATGPQEAPPLSIPRKSVHAGAAVFLDFTGFFNDRPHPAHRLPPPPISRCGFDITFGLLPTCLRVLCYFS